MRPGARIQAAIEIVEAIEASLRDGGAAADQIIQYYFRARRYAGSKDRRTVIDMVYGVLRQRGELVWRLEQAEQIPNARLMVLLCAGTDELSENGAHGPASLTVDEQTGLEAAKAVSPDDMPDHTRFNVPDWLMPSLRDALGEGLATEMAAHQGRAPLDLRVNALKSTSNEARKALPEAEAGQWSPLALRLPTGTAIQNSEAYTQGIVEVQDEGSQVAALLVNAQPGEQVLDLCAGAGGKTLVLAAMMENKGQLYAYDVDPKRLTILRQRAKRSNAKNINYISNIKNFSEKLDRIILDVPCSGSGTWRRNPDLRWRLMPDRLKELMAVQDDLLDQGARLLSSGGQIIYITCSILPEEGEARIAAFLKRHAGFRLVPYHQNWPLGDRDPAPTTSSNPDCLRLSPFTHQTDGFFVAVLECVE